MEEKEIKEIAEQLRCPSGEKGSQVATILEESNAYMVNQTINSLGKIKDLTLLELGPGNGYHLTNILENCQKAYTVEISDLMYQKIEKRFPNEISTGVLINLLGDGKTINIPNDTVDKAFTVNTIYFWSNPKKYLSEIGKCMKQGGDLFSQLKNSPFLDMGLNYMMKIKSRISARVQSSM